MTAEHDRIPAVETRHGIGIHAFQPRERIETVVRPAIDRVRALSAPDALMAYLADPTHPPEARLLAAARIEALWQLAAENRELRPKISLTMVRAYTAGLDSLRWASASHYGTLLQHPSGPGQPALPKRDARCAAELRAAQGRGPGTSATGP